MQQTKPNENRSVRAQDQNQQEMHSELCYINGKFQQGPQAQQHSINTVTTSMIIIHCAISRGMPNQSRRVYMCNTAGGRRGHSGGGGEGEGQSMREG